MSKNNWNWKKIEDVDSLPDFNRAVLLYEENDGKRYAIIGSLKSVDGDGYHWSNGGINDIFTNIFGAPHIDNNFKPSHWCEVEIPKD